MSADQGLYIAAVLFLLAAVWGLLVVLMTWLIKRKQSDPWESPEPEHQGPWGNSEMRGDSTHGD